MHLGGARGNIPIVAIVYPFSQFCETNISLLSLQTQPKTAPNLFQRGVEYGKYDLPLSSTCPAYTNIPKCCWAQTYQRAAGHKHTQTYQRYHKHTQHAQAYTNIAKATVRRLYGRLAIRRHGKCMWGHVGVHQGLIGSPTSRLSAGSAQRITVLAGCLDFACRIDVRCKDCMA